MMFKKLVISTALVGALGSVVLVGSHVVFANSGQSTGNTVSNYAVTNTALSTSESNLMSHFGFSEQPTFQSGLLAQQQILNNIQSIISYFQPTNVNVQMVDFTRSLGPNKFASINAAQSAGDPNIHNSEFHNVPSYDVTLDGVTLPSNAEMGGSTTQTGNLHVIVDGTNGKVLMMFAVR